MNLIKTLGICSYHDNTDEPYMCENQTEHFKKILHKWREHLLHSAGETNSYLQRESGNIADVTDNATQVEEHDHRIRFNERDRKLAKRIETTIRSLQEGKYGFCEICECEIGIKRLEARPVANMCIDCKTLAEEAENVY